jgi:hypothetical protein
MYDGVADADSEVVFLGFALDTGRRSLANGSASLGSTPVASLGSTPVAPTRSVTKPGSGMPDLVKLGELLNHTFPDFPTDALLDVVKTYGLPDLVKSLELLKSVESLTHSFPGFSGGGGGGSSDVLTNMLPELVQSLGIPYTLAAPLPEARVSPFAEAPVSAPTEAADPARDLPNVGLPEPVPPKSYAQSPDGGSGGGSPSGSGEGSPSGSGGGSSSGE